jgi:hypothetical protein
MSEHIVCIDCSEIREGRLEELKTAMNESVESSDKEVSQYIPVSTPCSHHYTHERKHEHRGCRFYGRYQR